MRLSSVMNEGGYINYLVVTIIVRKYCQKCILPIIFAFYRIFYIFVYVKYIFGFLVYPSIIPPLHKVFKNPFNY